MKTKHEAYQSILKTIRDIRNCKYGSITTAEQTTLSSAERELVFLSYQAGLEEANATESIPVPETDDSVTEPSETTTQPIPEVTVTEPTSTDVHPGDAVNVEADTSISVPGEDVVDGDTTNDGPVDETVMDGDAKIENPMHDRESNKEPDETPDETSDFEEETSENAVESQENEEISPENDVLEDEYEETAEETVDETEEVEVFDEEDVEDEEEYEEEEDINVGNDINIVSMDEVDLFKDETEKPLSDFVFERDIIALTSEANEDRGAIKERMIVSAFPLEAKDNDGNAKLFVVVEYNGEFYMSSSYQSANGSSIVQMKIEGFELMFYGRWTNYKFSCKTLTTGLSAADGVSVQVMDSYVSCPNKMAIKNGHIKFGYQAAKDIVGTIEVFPVSDSKEKTRIYYIRHVTEFVDYGELSSQNSVIINTLEGNKILTMSVGDGALKTSLVASDL